jgi:polyisoprenoid-binding protein YceI
MAWKVICAFLIGMAIPLITVGGQSCYVSDADHGELKFSGVAEGNIVRGDFKDFTVEACLEGEGLSTGRIKVEVQTGSASVGIRQGDEALLGEEMFFAERYPKATWTSDSIEPDDNDAYLAEGKLALRSVSAPQAVRLRLEHDGDTLKLSGDAEIFRMEFEVGQGEFADTDFVDDQVKLEFDLRLVPAS